MATSRRFRLFGPATVAAASTVVTTAAIQTLGAFEVACVLKASNASALSAVVYEFSLDDGVNWNAADPSFFDALQGNAVGASLVAGKAMVLGSRSAAGTAIPRIIATHVRFKLTGNAGASPANDTLNVTADAFAFYDGVGPVP